MKTDSSKSSAVTSTGRRKVLKGFAGAAALAGIGGAALAQQSKEAPALAKMVSDGKLPPLAQRLPSTPLVVQAEKVGVYGGTLRRGLRGSADHNGILRMVGNQGLVRWNMAFTEVLPCVASRWEVNATSTEFTFHLRPGMKWSDGKPFTADDIVFSIEDCCKNSELYKSVPSALVIANKPGQAVKVNDATVQFVFASPYALFLEQLATPLGQHPTLFAKHYCSQFHPKYNPNVAALAKAANLSDWAALFRNKCGDIEIPSRWGNTEKPTLDPWVVTEAYSGGVTRVVMERNPYFWQVDQSGQQLPYIDRLNFSIAQDVESLMLDALSGKLDIQERHIDTLQNKPTLSQNMQKGGYRLIELINASAQQVQIYLNITHKDAEDARDVRQQGVSPGAVPGHQPQGDHRAGLPGAVGAVPDRSAAEPSLVPRKTGAPIHQLRPQAGQRPARRPRLQQARRAALPAAPGRAAGFLCDRRDSDALSGRGRYAGTGQAPLGRHRRRHEGQYHRARAVLHARRQQRPRRRGLARARAGSIRCSIRATFLPSTPRARATPFPGRCGMCPAAKTARNHPRARSSA